MGLEIALVAPAFVVLGEEVKAKSNVSGCTRIGWIKPVIEDEYLDLVKVPALMSAFSFLSKLNRLYASVQHCRDGLCSGIVDISVIKKSDIGNYLRLQIIANPVSDQII